jgi:hypothetical protein
MQFEQLKDYNKRALQTMTLNKSIGKRPWNKEKADEYSSILPIKEQKRILWSVVKILVMKLWNSYLVMSNV